MFTQSVTRTLNLLLGPHGVDRYTELLDPMWTSESRATVVAVHRPTARTVTLTLEPNRPLDYEAGQHLAVTVEIDGRRHTRCYSPANAPGAAQIELTITRHDGGTVSGHLYRSAEPGMVVDLDSPAGDFVLPRQRPRRLLLIAGGSGITPVMGMLRTLQQEGFDGDVAVVHYIRNLHDACYRDDIAAMPGVRAFYGCTRTGESNHGGDFSGHLDATHLSVALADPDAVYVCGPPALVDAVRDHYPSAVAESFAPRAFVVPDAPGGGRITFRNSGTHVENDGRPILDQAEAAGISPQYGCRMGICHTCTRRKHSGVVRNLTTGAVNAADDQDIQVCVSVPVGDVDVAL